jgi:hypothetical protein
MSLCRVFVVSILLAGIGLSARPARAATVTWGLPTWENREGTNLRLDLLNRQDCLNDAIATFAVSVVGASSSAVLELWAGTNCDTLANRTGSGAAKTCTQLTSSVSAFNIVGSLPVKVRFQDMVKPFDAAGDGTAATCDLEKSSGLVTRTLYFVVYNSGSTASEASGTKPWTFKYDVKAPAPPTNVSAGSGEASLVPHFTPPSGETNLLRYRFYCSEVGSPPADDGTAGTSTGGTASTDVDAAAGTDSGDAGAGATTTTAGTAGTTGTSSTPIDPNCTSTVLVPGKPPAPGAIDCGEVGAQGASGGETRSVLDNGTTYVVAIAAEDTAYNVGVLSALACGTPQDVRGFYEAYREAGGQAGGGYCSFGPPRRGTLASVAALLVAACAFLRRRR